LRSLTRADSMSGCVTQRHGYRAAWSTNRSTRPSTEKSRFGVALAAQGVGFCNGSTTGRAFSSFFLRGRGTGRSIRCCPAAQA
jgi:hypothetical protein